MTLLSLIGPSPSPQSARADGSITTSNWPAGDLRTPPPPEPLGAPRYGTTTNLETGREGERAPSGMENQVAAGLLARRVILLDRALEDDNVSALCSQLLLLSQEDPVTDIVLAINSPGGSVPGMLAIADLMELIPNDVRTLALGMAYSAGQFLLSAGTPGKRYALPHSTVLLHQGSAGFGGSAVDIALQAQHLRNTRDTVLGLIAKHTGQPLERVTEDSQRDRIWDAQGARDYGFVDHVVTDVAAVLSVKRQAGVVGPRPSDGGDER